MPYRSVAQERFFHTDTAAKKGITPVVVHEFDQASKGMNLPKRVKPHTDGLHKAMSKIGGGY